MGFIKYIDIDWPDLFRPILTSKTNFFNRIRVRREVIPIIFVPGAMGSRLKRGSEVVWDPDDRVGMFNRYGRKKCTPAKRKEFLIGPQFNPEWLQVSEDDAKHNQKFFSMTDPWRDHRGWGGVLWTYYGELLEELQNYNWNKPVCSEDKDKKKELAGKCFEFPVHAFGYNWTDSCLNTGKKLAEKIDEIINGYKKRGRLCEYVIIVTHSMGGLVARSACCIEHEGIDKAHRKVLGVIHGVQPAVGAAAAYWRMKAGFERTGIVSTISAWVLGASGEEVTCLLGNAPGGLELLPTKDYITNDGSKQWLHVTLKNGKKISLPKSDPYTEIYRIGEQTNMITKKLDAPFWRLVNPEWLDPKNKKTGSRNSDTNRTDSWAEYIICIDLARIFHDELKTRFHKNTYQFYSSGLDTVDKINFKHEEFFYRKQPTLGVEISVPSRKVSSRGKSIMYADIYNQEIITPLSEPHKTLVASMSSIDDYREGGDGTVPNCSGSALKECDGSKILVTSRFNKIEHQEAYNKRKGKDFVITAIRNLSIKRIEKEINEGG
ncbi:MAG: alpha/beta hydrolase [Geobacteraceae bacterium]|nr:alpha/beta hydrolase [Geobacteraceae bacterium]